MTTTTNRSLLFRRTAWNAGAFSAVLSELVPVLGATEAHVKFTQALSDGTTVTTDGGPEELCDLTEIPIGHNVIVAQYLRNATTPAVDISNLDILSLSVQNVVLVFGATDDHYQIDILMTDTRLQSLTTSLLIDRLSLQNIKPD